MGEFRCRSRSDRRAAVVKLTDRIASVPGLMKPVAPRGRRSAVRKCVVPVADGVDIAPGGEARPARNADRTVAVRVLEQCARSGERIEIRRAHDAVSVRAEHPTAVFVRHDEDDVLSGHCFTSSCSLGISGRLPVDSWSSASLGMATQSATGTVSTTSLPAGWNAPPLALHAQRSPRRCRPGSRRRCRGRSPR